MLLQQIQVSREQMMAARDELTNASLTEDQNYDMLVGGVTWCQGGVCSVTWCQGGVCSVTWCYGRVFVVSLGVRVVLVVSVSVRVVLVVSFNVSNVTESKSSVSHIQNIHVHNGLHHMTCNVYIYIYI